MRRLAWDTIRYERLLPFAARSRGAGRLYAPAIGAIELGRNPERQRLAVDRISRWLGVPAAEARGIFHRALVSEAREEADSVYFMRHPDELRATFRPPVGEPGASQATVFCILHFGSPILTYIYLTTVRNLPVGLIGRALDDANPMDPAKRGYGRRKVAWVERLTGRPFLGTDASALANARAELLAGRSLCAAVDVPGDVVARTTELDILGGRARISAGVPTLARLGGAPLVLVNAISTSDGIEILYGEPVESHAGDAFPATLRDDVSALLRAHPGEWWLWPYVSEVARGA